MKSVLLSRFEKNMNSTFFLILCLGLIAPCILEEISNSLDEKSPDSKKHNQETLPPCQACRLLANSFKKGMDRTSRGKFDGGDASWEESRLKAYSKSEIRFVEIQEKICSEEEKTSNQCHRLAEEHESLLEDWWFKKRESHPDVFYFLCIDKLQVCCPENHFGPDCRPCIGGLVNTCSGHGKCKGGGSRKGSGLCRCDSGYTGDFCDQCKTGYYNATSTESWLCVSCDQSCKEHCREGGPKGCEVCADGYEYSTETGCVDVNECIEFETNPCIDGTFCANSIGSFHCVDCDKSCNGCTGDGPDMCEKCAEGYTFQEPLCIESKTSQRAVHVEIARYATYLGFCIATLIIFKRSFIVASIIGLCVAVYIGLSEYTIGDWDERSVIKSIKSLSVL